MSGMTHDVFISFSFKDQAVAEYIANRLLNQYSITYWICTRELRAGEHYKAAIVEAIKAAKIVLLIQSQNSVVSDEVPKEISRALNYKKVVIPFVLDDSELVGDLEYDLSDVQRIDATRPTLEQRIDDLARQVDAILNSYASVPEQGSRKFRVEERLVPTANLAPKKIFCGREELIQQLREGFLSGEHVQFLHGIGGIGKTQIAKQYAKKYKNDYDTVIFATYGGCIRDMILAQAPFTIEPKLGRYTMSDGTLESDAEYFVRKVDKIKALANRRMLIIIDNYDTEEDKDLSALLQAQCDFLITTRCDYSRHYSTIKVDAIQSDEQLRRLFAMNYDGYDVEEDDPRLSELFQLVNRHTYTVELLAQHMENSGQNVSEMIDCLKREGIMSLNESVTGEDMIKQTAYENILKLFKIFTLTEEEKQVLTYLSFMPLSGVNVRNFRYWADLDSTKIIKELEIKGWLFKNTDGIALHPIIKDVVACKIPAKLENCKDFLTRFTDSIEDKKTWVMEKAEKDKLAGVARGVLAAFDTICEETEELYYHAQALFSFFVDTTYAVTLAERLCAYHREKYGEHSFLAARAIFKLGWVYSFNSQIPDSHHNAKMWLEKANDLFEGLTLTTSDEISRLTMTKNNLSQLCLAQFKQTQNTEELKAAKEYALESIELAQRSFTPGEFHYGKIAGGYFHLVEVLLAAEDYEESLACTDKAIDILTELFDASNVDVMYGHYLKAEAMYGLGRYEQAKALAQASVDGYSKYFGLYHPKNSLTYQLMGDCCRELGQIEAGISAYQKALEIAEKIYAPDAVQMVQLKEKLSALPG